LKLSRNAGNWS